MNEWSRIGEGAGVPGLVSIVIPTFNRAYILPAALESVLAQSYRFMEVIVVDDGSTDDTRSVVQKYESSGVRYFYQENAGVSAARNRGFLEARGEFVALEDSDDAWVGWKLEAQVAVLRAFPQAGMVWTDITAVKADGTVVDPRYMRHFLSAYDVVKMDRICDIKTTLKQLWPQAPAEAADAQLYVADIFPHMIFGNLVPTPTVLLRRERLRATGPFDPSFRYTGEDYEFHFRAALHGPVAFLDTSTLRYRVGATDQLTAPSLGVHMARNNLTTVQRYLASYPDRIRVAPEALRERLVESYNWIGRHELLAGNNSEARRHLWQSLRLCPRQLYIVKLFLASCFPSRMVLGAQKFRQRLFS